MLLTPVVRTLSLRKRPDIGEGLAEVAFVAVLFDVAQMRRTENARMSQQRMIGLQDRLLLENIQRCLPRPTAIQRFEQRPRSDQLGAAGIDQQRVGFHPRQVGGDYTVPGGRQQAQVQAEREACLFHLYGALLGLCHEIAGYYRLPQADANAVEQLITDCP